MPFARTNLRGSFAWTALCLLIALPATSRAAGVTLITHGRNGVTDGWVRGMADALSVRLGGNLPIYRIDVTSGSGSLATAVTKIAGGAPLSSVSGEVIVMLDWRDISEVGQESTFNIAAAVAPLFAQTNLIDELGGHALAEFPIHLAGHSRGGSLVCELSKKLGELGIWVDQVTNLDSYPTTGDAPALTYENVLFGDSYYQTINFYVKGNPIPGCFTRKQTAVDGGYGNGGLAFLDFLNGHSDIHLWYHGTIDLNTPTTDGDTNDGEPVALTAAMRDAWWSDPEQRGTNAGFIYSRLGGGDRLSTNQPNDSDSSPIRDGFNRYYEVGGGAGPSNRTPVGSNTGEWPNPIRFDLVTTNVVEQGTMATLEIYFQWAQPNTSTQTVQVLADPDLNPLNGNEILLDEGFVTGTTAAQVVQGAIDLEFDGGVIAADDYWLLVEMTAGSRSRYLYASEPIQLTTSTLPLVLDITAPTNSMLLLGVNGVAGQTAVLEKSADGAPWLPVATNTLTSSRWEMVESLDAGTTLTLFRGRLETP